MTFARPFSAPFGKLRPGGSGIQACCNVTHAQQVAAAISLLAWCAHLIIAVTKPSAAILLLIRGSPSSI
jgi:hypothetical protein